MPFQLVVVGAFTDVVVIWLYSVELVSAIVRGEYMSCSTEGAVDS